MAADILPYKTVPTCLGCTLIIQSNFAICSVLTPATREVSNATQAKLYSYEHKQGVTAVFYNNKLANAQIGQTEIRHTVLLLLATSALHTGSNVTDCGTIDC